MARPIEIPLPELRFPEAGFRSRIEAYAAAQRPLDLKVELRPPAPFDAIEKALGLALPGDLRALLEATGGGRIGHLVLLAPADIVQETRRVRAGAERGLPVPAEERSTLIAFATDIEGDPWTLTTGSGSGSGSGAVVLAPRDQDTPERRFTSLAAFLEIALVEAWAEAAHRRAEEDAGDDLDDQPWVEAARRIALRIDPNQLRGRD